MLVIDKIESLFGDNYQIKSKKVLELVQSELIKHECTNPYGYDIHYFYTPKKYKVGKKEFDLVLKATQLRSGKWWIQA
jgi:hypothetical protein